MPRKKKSSSASDIIKEKPTRKKIPKAVREQVWDFYMGTTKMEGKCYCCDWRTITFREFEVGHDKAVAKGGNDNISNLRPICRKCNSSMKTISIEQFKKKYFKNSKTRAIIEDKKEDREFYSPIHAMIVRANNKFSRESALENIVGAWLSVKQLGIDYRKISETFDQNSTKFNEEDLKKWVEIEEQIKKPINGGGFFLGRDIQEWFDDLESRYNPRK